MFRTGRMHEQLPEMKKHPHLGRMQPFRVAGNTYFVGTYQASSHLIDTGDGLILIDAGYEKGAYLVLDSIYRLGFRPEDIKYIFLTHWHGDHAEAVPCFVALSGAKTLIGKADAEKAKRYFTPDILLSDGDTLTLGNTTLHFMHTPGHTAGTMSFFYETEEDGKTLRVGSFGGAGVNTLARGTFDFEGAREAYLASLERLREEEVDVFIGNHTWNNDTYTRSVAFRAGVGANPFINPMLFRTFLDACEQRLIAVVKREEAEERAAR